MQSALDSALAQANLGFSAQIQQAAGSVIGSLLSGGNLGSIGAPENLIGLTQIPPPGGVIGASRQGATARSSNGSTRSPASPRRT